MPVPDVSVVIAVDDGSTDDWLGPQALERLVAAADRPDADIVTHGLAWALSEIRERGVGVRRIPARVSSRIRACTGVTRTARSRE